MFAIPSVRKDTCNTCGKEMSVMNGAVTVPPDCIHFPDATKCVPKSLVSSIPAKPIPQILIPKGSK